MSEPINIDVREFKDCSSLEDHNFTIKYIHRAEFTKGNAQCMKVTRIYIFCTRCGQGKFVEDTENPPLGSPNDEI